MRELIILGTASQVPTRTRTPNGRSSNFGSIQVRPDFVHGRSVRLSRYLFEQQSSPSRVEVTDAHAPRVAITSFRWLPSGQQLTTT
jgi:hypothetical protein